MARMRSIMQKPTISLKNFENCIIDCIEVFIERPFNRNARTQKFSNYKSRNTIKYWVDITPLEAVCFLPARWGGRASDKEITLNSGFLGNVTFGNCVLTDRGFLIEKVLAAQGVVLWYHLLLKERHECLQKMLTCLEGKHMLEIHVHELFVN